MVYRQGSGQEDEACSISHKLIHWIAIAFMVCCLLNGVMDLAARDRIIYAMIMICGSIIAIASTLRLIFKQT